MIGRTAGRHPVTSRPGDLGAADRFPTGVDGPVDAGLHRLQRLVGSPDRLGSGVGQNQVGGVDDPLPSGADDLLRTGIAGGLAGPPGHVTERVLARIEPVGTGDHVGDRLGLHLPQPTTAAILPVGADQDVPQFVGQRLDRLRVVHIGPDPHHTLVVQGESVRGATVTAFQPEPSLSDQGGEAVP